MQTEYEIGRGVGRAQARRSMPALVLDRDATERFLKRATELVPPGDVTTALTVGADDGPRRFPTLRDLAADPDLPTHVRALEIAIGRREAGESTHDVVLGDDDGQTLLVVSGEELWAHGTLAILVSLLEIYAKRLVPQRLAPLRTFTVFSVGFTLGLALAIGHFRGVPAALASAAICGAVWFVLDLALSELRVALTARAPLPLTIELRTQRRKEPRATAVRLWLFARGLALALWPCVAYVVFAYVVPHVPKVW